MIRTELAIDPRTGVGFRSVFDTETCTPVEPIQRFLNYCGKRQLAQNTIDTYAYRLVDYWRWLMYKSLDWSEVGLEELADFADWYLFGGGIDMISEEVKEIHSKRNPRTVNQSLTIIQSFYEFHFIEGRIDEKRFTRLVHRYGKRGGFLQGIVKNAPEQRNRIKLKESKVFRGCLNDDEVLHLANSCTTFRDRLIVLLLRETGIRRGELMGLHLEDIKDLDVNNRIHIVRRNNPNKAWAKGCEREIPLLCSQKEVLKILEAYLSEEYPKSAEKLGHGMLFVSLEGNNVGHPMSLIRLNKLFEQLSKRSGIDKVHPHLFRHTYATWLIRSKYPDHYVMQLLGHKSIITTKNIYCHILKEIELDRLLKNGNEK